ncbi:MAG: hypothetical protein ACXWLS_10130, partial [Myxococcaceae bacterium]
MKPLLVAFLLTGTVPALASTALQLEVEVLETWKGSAAGRLTVVQPGGEVDGIGQRVTGVAQLAQGEELV